MRTVLMTATCLAALLAAGCGFMRMTGDRISASLPVVDFSADGASRKPDRIEQTSVLTGTVTGNALPGTPVIVAAFARTPDPASGTVRLSLVDHVVLPAASPYCLFVHPGDYTVLAFADANADFILAPDELAGSHGRPDVVTVAVDEVVSGVDIALFAPGKRRFFSQTVSLRKLPRRAVRTDALEYGGTSDLGNEIFQPAYGELGEWRPVRFIEKIGIHVYALEPYDPRRVPVLFVHGIGGTPRDWRYPAAQLDRRYYQPWFYYYPTGLRLTTAADLLVEKVAALKARYGFERLCIVAHSMGGLVARAFINRCQLQGTAGILQCFVTLSTPWGGDKHAQLAVDTSPVQSDAWLDIAVGSRFLRDLYRTPLPDHMPFYLFYTYSGSRPFQTDANDGVVTVASQLDPRARSDADRIEGFRENHSGVLRSAAVAERLNRILQESEVDGELRAAAAAPPAVKETSSGLYNDEISTYIRLLTSIDSNRQRTGARLIYRKKINNPRMFDTAEQELLDGYLVNLADSGHIDAMAWMCNLLGASGQARYRPTLEKVALADTHPKIKRYARLNLGKLK
jgi:pimeloyl-ACP methyl ester carboxylesterase